MTDFDFDCLERKRISYGARHRKRGSKSRACSLPSDYLTKKQWKERNGPCMTMNLNKPMRWEEFKNLSDGMQSEYLQHITDTFKVGRSKIASDLFGCTSDTLKKYVDSRGLDVVFHSASGSKPRDQVEAWREFLGITVCENNQNDDAEEPKPMEDLGDHPDVRTQTMRMSGASISFDGVLDLQMVLNSLRYIVGDNSEGTITITFASKETVAES